MKVDKRVLISLSTFIFWCIVSSGKMMIAFRRSVPMQVSQNLIFIFLIGYNLSLLSIKPLESGHTPLQQAIINGSVKEVRHLLMSGINVNEIDGYGRTAVHFASQENNLEVLNLLYEAGANIDVKDFLGDTPLMCAAVYGHSSIVAKLISAGADKHVIDIADNNLLHIAARHGRDEVAKILLHAGVDWEAKNIHGSVPLDEAEFIDFFKNDRIEVASVLREWAQDPKTRFLYWLKNHLGVTVGIIGVVVTLVGGLTYHIRKHSV